MDVQEKLQILADAAKYDVSCSSSGSRRKNTGGIGNGSVSGICHSWTADGRCISLLKILLSNDCIYDCAYCVNRCSNDVPRATFTPQEAAELTIQFYRRNYIEGLFLSSAVTGNPDHTMEKLIETAQLLRELHHFNGYIHLKAIPGADPMLIQQAGFLADRMSVNIELPSSKGLKLLAPQKSKQAILTPMRLIGTAIQESCSQQSRQKKNPRFAPAGQSTQLMIGATADNDYTIMTLSESLYRTFRLKRVYYSAYVPVVSDRRLPVLNSPPLLREHRLYQADWLLRYYGFTSGELLDQEHPDFNLDFDPKTNWALRHLDQFPLEINHASLHMLLRVPGIGVRSARRIMAARRFAALSAADICKLGVVYRRARYFITCNGRYDGGKVMDVRTITAQLLPKTQQNNIRQLSLFTLPAVLDHHEQISAITGEL